MEKKNLALYNFKNWTPQKIIINMNIQIVFCLSLHLSVYHSNDNN